MKKAYEVTYKDGETFEAVLIEAAKKLNVEL